MSRFRVGSLVFLLLLATYLPVLAQTSDRPEAASGRQEKLAVEAERQMVAAANPLAAEAGLAMLRRGGSAIDAAIAVQMVLNLVEPQSSGIGGGAFLVLWTASRGELVTYDGRETAPAAARADRFIAPDGKPVPFPLAVVGGRSVGVPGLLRMLELAHQRHGRLPWADLFGPAIALADAGFAISPRLHGLLATDPALRQIEAARRYFYAENGAAWPVGHRLRNPAFAETLRVIAAHGADAFYRGPLANAVVAAVRNAPVNPGDMTLADLRDYRAVERPPLCAPHGVWRICGMGPPSSGPLAVLQIMSMTKARGVERHDPMSATAAHLFAEAGRLAFADRNIYLADPDFVPQPDAGLLDPGYLAARARLIDPAKAMTRAEPGNPPRRRAQEFAPGESFDLPATSHISIVDAQGNVLSMTTTIESQFGSRLFVAGFLLNNQLTDFSFVAEQDGKPIANRIEPGKRPRSSMSPLIVFDAARKPVLSIGSPGGSAIINYVARATLGILDWRLDPQTAVSLPHFGNRGGATELERGTAAERLKAPLEALGHRVSVTDLTSGTQAILIRNGRLLGGADPRREGVALGD